MIRVRIPVRELNNAIKRIDRQGRFAFSQAMNDTVEMIKQKSIGWLPRYFKIRSGWLARGFRTGHAKRDLLVAWVGQKDEFLVSQAMGGKKFPKEPFQAVPQKGPTLGSIPTPRGSSGERATYRGANWPRQLVKAVELYEKKVASSRKYKKGSKGQSRSLESAAKTRAASNRLVFLRNAKVPTIAIRIASGGGRGKYLPLWFLKNAPVNIPKRWPFHADGEAFARSYITPAYDTHLKNYLNY